MKLECKFTLGGMGSIPGIDPHWVQSSRTLAIELSGGVDESDVVERIVKAFTDMAESELAEAVQAVRQAWAEERVTILNFVAKAKADAEARDKAEAEAKAKAEAEAKTKQKSKPTENAEAVK